MAEELLQIRNLNMHFPIQEGLFRKTTGYVKAVDGVSLTVNKGETVGIVGESGCGKTTLARMIMGLEKPTSGEILFEGQNILEFNRSQMHQLRRDIQMVFQDPMTSLNPRMKIGEIIAAPLRAYKATKNVEQRVKELMELVGLKPDAYNRLPHEFSGGQRQRIGIARAIALNPKLIICDEPVSALDVSIQAQVINLFKDLQDELNLTYLFISHDLSVVKHFSDKIAVMYLGKIMEKADSPTFFKEAQHPYSNALLSAIPLPDPEKEKQRQRMILKGDPPSPANPPSGCVFHTRCPFARDYCRQHTPSINQNGTGEHQVACFFPVEQDTQAQV